MVRNQETLKEKGGEANEYKISLLIAEDVATMMGRSSGGRTSPSYLSSSSVSVILKYCDGWSAKDGKNVA